MTITRYVIWVVLASVGCAAPMSALREDNRRLNQSVAEMRAERRAQDRKIRDLENQVALLKEDKRATSPSRDAMPSLPVEVVAPSSVGEGQRIVAYADDGDEIVYEGDAALGRQAHVPTTIDSPRSRDDDDAPARTASRPLSAARTSRVVTRSEPINDAANNDYRAAVELVKAGKTEDAVAALRTFLKSYPRNDYADNAQYWLGEAFYAQKDYPHALVEFRATIETYPRGNKVPDALLKVGYCYGALGQADKARAVLEQVVNLYPKTEPAALASKRLETP
ncbi:MAG TPA: tol-pal system protein YbgF [Kofleriaceae bacterium]|nr:tol-pal system protein YbgF [Kofleriaceae bacterium]